VIRSFSFSEEDKREPEEELIRYRKGAGNYENTMSTRNYRLSGSPRSQHVGHDCVAYDEVLEKGFMGIKADAEERLSRIDFSNAKEAEKAPFLEGVITAMTAAATIGKRFPDLAKEMAQKEEDRDRRSELLEIAEICHRVPANPARTSEMAPTVHESVRYIGAS